MEYFLRVLISIFYLNAEDEDESEAYEIDIDFKYTGECSDLVDVGGF